MEDNNNNSMAGLVQKLLQGGNININGQTIIGNTGTVNYYAAQADKGSVADFDSPAFADALKRVGRHIRQTPSAHWSQVYFYLKRNCGLPLMTGKAFGDWVEERTGIKSQNIRKDGDYDRCRPVDQPGVEAMTAFFEVKE